MKRLVLSGRVIETPRPAFVMGIVNVTPDSFWEKSRGGAESALRLIDEGADMLDIGGGIFRDDGRHVAKAGLHLFQGVHGFMEGTEGAAEGKAHAAGGVVHALTLLTQ